MKAPGFSFPCPCLVRSKNEKFERFIKTAEIDPSRIYNPFPLLAGLKTYRQARAQPLSCTEYLPTTNPDLYGSYLEEALTRTHELAHLVSDHSPAKVLARFLLGRAFGSLSALLCGLTWDCEMEKSWNELVKIIDDLRAICSAITLSEELLATAISFDVCTPYFREMPELIIEKEQKIVAKHTKHSRDFEELYFQTFKKVVQWDTKEQPSGNPLPILLYLDIFLQGIIESRNSSGVRIVEGAESGLRVVDSAKRCRILAKSVDAMRSGRELHDWLSRTLSGRKEVATFLAAWNLLEDLKVSSEERNCLWILMGGRDHQCDHLINHGTLLPG
jgi:hypothetical protein